MLTLLVTACGAGAQKPAIETVMASEDTRKESFEAVLRIFDEHPEYINELVKQLGAHPQTVKATLRALVLEARNDEQLRRALLDGLEQNGEPLAKLIVEHPEVLSSLMKSFAKAGMKQLGGE